MISVRSTSLSSTEVSSKRLGLLSRCSKRLLVGIKEERQEEKTVRSTLHGALRHVQCSVSVTMRLCGGEWVIASRLITPFMLKSLNKTLTLLFCTYFFAAVLNIIYFDEQLSQTSKFHIHTHRKNWQCWQLSSDLLIMS